MADLGPCPCGSGAAFGDCCGPLLGGERQAGTAEQLMRSRFTAFTREDEAHLLRTWDVAMRPTEVRFVPGQRWLRLDVLATSGGGFLDQDGTVEFTAHYERDGRPAALHERSRFERDADGRWVYVGPEAAELT